MEVFRGSDAPGIRRGPANPLAARLALEPRRWRTSSMSALTPSCNRPY